MSAMMPCEWAFGGRTFAVFTTKLASLGLAALPCREENGYRHVF